MIKTLSVSGNKKDDEELSRFREEREDDPKGHSIRGSIQMKIKM